MKLYLKNFWIVFLFVICAELANGQQIILKSDTIPVEQDSIVKLVLPEYRGQLHWQMSLDSINWNNINDIFSDTLEIKTYLQASYRAKIIEGTCDTVYSDTVYVINLNPLVVTDSARNVSYNSALLGGMIFNNEGREILEKGVCLSENENPTIDDFKFILEGDTSEYDTIVNGLTSNTIYYYKAYAINSSGIAYGEIFQFKTEILTYSVSKYITASEGDTISCPDNSMLIIPEDALSEDSDVKVEVTRKDSFEILNPNFKLIGNPYSIYFTNDSIKKNIYFIYELPQYLDSLNSIIFFLYNGDSYYPVEYQIHGKKIIININTLNWNNDFEVTTNNYLKAKSSFFNPLKVFIVPLQIKEQPPKEQMGLKEVLLENGNLRYTEPTLSSKSRTLLFIHGWIGAPSTWNEMIQNILSEQDFQDSKIWTFGYNSSLGIEENADILSTYLAKYTNNNKVDIVAHSMGGLVSRSLLEYYNGHKWVNKLVAIGTPHLGSPLEALKLVLGQVGLIPEYLVNKMYGNSFDINSQGFEDLGVKSVFIQKMKNSTNFQVPYFLIAAKNNPALWPPSNELILNGDDDGIVTVSSAFGVPGGLYSPIIHIPFPEAHTKMPKDSKVYEEVLKYIRLELNPPTVSLAKIINITQTTATSGGSVTFDGLTPIINRGVCWSTSSKPTIFNRKTLNGSGTGSFTSNIAGLEPNTTYYVRAYATNSAGTGYSETTLEFTTLPELSVPTVITSAATNITASSAITNGQITSDGGAPITQRGFYWCEDCDSISEMVSLAVVEGTPEEFNYHLTDLEPETNYAFAAFAKNNQGTSTGEVLDFTTPAKPPVGAPQLTAPANYSVFNKNNTENISIQWNSVAGADEYWLNVFPDGQSASPVFDNSVGSATNKTIALNTLLNGIYWIQVKARPSDGTWSEFSGSRQFVSDMPAETPTLSAPSNEASVTRNTLQNFSWTMPSAGIDRYNVRIVSGTNLDASPVYEAEIPGLKDSISCIWEPGTYTWSVRAMKETPGGYSDTDYETTIGWGNYAEKRTFTISEVATLPTVSVDPGPSIITSTTASVSGVVESDGNSTVTERGFCWGTSNNPTTENDKITAGSGTGAFSGIITGLTASKDYYYRSYATNSVGTAYSDTSINFTIQPEDSTGIFTDSRDGNTYKWVKIDEQVWMAENLAYLPEVNLPDGESRYHDTISVYYVYGYNGTNVEEAKAKLNYATYGVLYNYVAALEVCPSGWHLPSASEWEQLAQYISDTKGPYETDGAYFFNRSKHLKATYGWDNNGNGLDDFGFSAMPGGQYGSGYVQDSLQFGGIGNSGYWWSDTKSWFLYHFTETFYGAGLSRESAQCIRCVKD